MRANYQVIEVTETGTHKLAEPGFKRTDYVAARNFACTCYEVRAEFNVASVYVLKNGAEQVFEIDNEGNRFEKDQEESGPCNSCGAVTPHLEPYKDNGFYFCSSCWELAGEES